MDAPELKVTVTATWELTLHPVWGQSFDDLRAQAIKDADALAIADAGVSVSFVPPSTDDEIAPEPTRKRYKPDNEDGKGNQLDDPRVKGMK